MKATQFLSGVFIKASDCQTPFAALIVGDEISEFKKPDGTTETKLTLLLDVNGQAKKLSLNKTMTTLLVGAWGDETESWRGRKIAVYFDPSVSFGNKTVGGIRIKLPGVSSKAEVAAEAKRKAEAALEAMMNMQPEAGAAPEPGSNDSGDDLPVL